MHKEMNRPRQDSEGYHSTTNLSQEDLDVFLTNSERLIYSTIEPLIEKDKPNIYGSEYSTGGPPPSVGPTSDSDYHQTLHIPRQSPPSSYITPVGEVVEHKRLPNKSHTWCCFGLLLTIVNIVLLIGGTVVVVLLYFKYSDLQYEINAMMKKSEDASEVCMPCGDLKVGIFEEDNAQLQFLIRKEVSNVEVCCAKTSDQTRIMFDLVSIYLLVTLPCKSFYIVGMGIECIIFTFKLMFKTRFCL